MAKRKKSRYLPPKLPKECAECGSRQLIITRDITALIVHKGQAPPFFCSDCRSIQQAAIDRERHAGLASTLRLATARSLTLHDNRTERWLETPDDIVRQSRATPDDEWADTPSDELEPATDGKTRRVRSCVICKQSPKTVNVQLLSQNKRHVIVGICVICARIASKTNYSVRLDLHGNGNTIINPFRLTQCPGCDAPVLQTKQPAPCSSCTEDAARAAQRLTDRPETYAEIKHLMAVNPGASCHRCDPDSRKEPYLCPHCRTDYLEMPENWFPNFAPPHRNGPCAVCNCKGASIAVSDVDDQYGRTYVACTACARIAHHQDVRHWKTGNRLRLSICDGCGRHRNGLISKLCGSCRSSLRKIETALTDLCDYLWLVLERPEGQPVPAPTREVARWLRPDSTTKRADAPDNKRLNPHLSREVCREYVMQEREIPELAIRFNVPATSIRNTLRGKSWANHTADVRPNQMRTEPPRTRRPIERPPTMTITRLKDEFGWTDALISKHLGTEDVQLKNPHYSTSAPMRLYLVDRVQSVTTANPTLQRQLSENLQRRRKR